MSKIFLVIFIALFLSNCGKKSEPEYKSEDLKENIIIVS